MGRVRSPESGGDTGRIRSHSSSEGSAPHDSRLGPRIPSRASTKMSLASKGPTHGGKAIPPPDRGFVINVRRLIAASASLGIVHEFIKSTAIAALTLVQAGSFEQLRISTIFVGCSVSLYVLHDAHWDSLDVADTAKLVPLLANDDLETNAGVVANPNRILKALRITTSSLWKTAWSLLHLFYLIIIAMAWVFCERWWSQEIDYQDDTDEGLINKWAKHFIRSDEDGEALSTQLLVGTFMFMLHLLFESLYSRETCCVMPRTPDGRIWDPRNDGVPLRYWLLGLPSMWFTSDQAYCDVLEWIDKANPIHQVRGFYPEEIALYALRGDEERRVVGQALKHAKLFDGCSRKLITRGVTADPHNTEPESLNLEIVFFDRQLQNKNCSKPGEFLSMEDEEVDDAFQSCDTTRAGGGMVVRKSVVEKHPAHSWVEKTKALRERFGERFVAPMVDMSQTLARDCVSRDRSGGLGQGAAGESRPSSDASESPPSHSPPQGAGASRESTYYE